jgi:Ca-activated chloride channel family protein
MDLLLSGSLNEFHFLRPLWLLLMLPVVLLVFYLWRINESSSAWDKAIDKSLLPYLLDKRKNSSQRMPLLLLLLVWLASVIALAGPVWERIPQPVQKSQDALVIILDLSLSMYATDYDPNRLTIARRKLLDVLTLRSEGQTGLVVYAGDAHTVTPLTDDSVTISALAPSLSPNIMPSFGSNPVVAIERAVSLLIEAGSPSGRLLLITDGIESRDARGIQEILQQNPYSLSVLGIGTRQGAPIPASNGDFLRDSSGNIVIPAFDSSILENLVSSVGGRYSNVVLSSSDLDYLLADYSFGNDQMLGESGETFDIWQDAGPWLLLLILPLSAMIFRRGWVLTLVLTGTALSSMVIPTAPAQAAGWQDLWKTRNQQAAEALASEDAETAAALFEATEWKGTAAYRAGDYEGAIQSFSQQTDVTSLYNLGNAYAQARKFEEAIQAYEAALAIENDHVDALHNKEIVEQLLEEQEQQEEEDRQNQEQQEQDQEQQESAQSEPDENNSDPQEQEPQDPDGEENEQEPQSDDSEQQQQQQEQQEAEDASTAETEDQESLEQWLRRINDDPGELLQRKFQFEYRRRQLENRNAGNPPVERQIW